MIDPNLLNEQRALIQRLVVLLEKENAQVTVFETHISWVLVAGKFAYKFKKAVHFDFLDFSTLEARRFYCDEELRLNRRLAPDLYLGVTCITGSAANPSIDRSGAPIEYAVRMRAFPQQALWNHRIDTHSIAITEIVALAAMIARFHQTTASAAPDSAWGAPAMLKATADETLATIAALLCGEKEQAQVREITAWVTAQQRKLRDTFARRKSDGMIRECHGDLHSANILTIDGQVQVFDCIEFNDSLRWIDVMNDIAFVCMDLEFQQRPELAARFLNQYLQHTGDYDGLVVLRYYEVQRALVRCKVTLLRARQLQCDGKDGSSQHEQALGYLALAVARSKSMPVAIMITHGFSGSGKSTFASCVAELLGAIQLRSDVERKRLHGLAATARVVQSGTRTGLYDARATQVTYEHLLNATRRIIESGFSVIVDAAFLRSTQRAPFVALADTLGVPFFLFDIRASESAMKQRIALRTQLDLDASDAGLEVLAHQLRQNDSLSENESAHAIIVDTEAGINASRLRELAVPVVRALRQSSAQRDAQRKSMR
jgi:uncharacterized protein